ncbi:hypothetical protein FB451DRAFT_1434273 [Mycena latifolia]|nr:hypothetical protein FB451DRAFT_1434273 [Mycena latifolia]
MPPCIKTGMQAELGTDQIMSITLSRPPHHSPRPRRRRRPRCLRRRRSFLPAASPALDAAARFSRKCPYDGARSSTPKTAALLDARDAALGGDAHFYLVRANECTLVTRQVLSTCGPAPRLETLHLYHFEDYRTAQSVLLATYRAPMAIFDNVLPTLKNVSLIGVNFPWAHAP